MISFTVPFTNTRTCSCNFKHNLLQRSFARSDGQKVLCFQGDRRWTTVCEKPAVKDTVMNQVNPLTFTTYFSTTSLLKSIFTGPTLIPSMLNSVEALHSKCTYRTISPATVTCLVRLNPMISSN